MKIKISINIIFVLSLLALAVFPANALAAPQALFDVDVVAGIAPYTAHFTYMGNAAEVDSYFWDFGDGSTSTEQNPSHTYTGAALLSARLTVTNATGSSTATVEMRVYPADFVPPMTTYYIDATLGNDANSGTSPDSPKKDLNAISRPKPGDTILFKRGEVWEDPDSGAALYIRESGMPGYPITYGAYGDGSKPKPTIKRQARVPGWDNPANWVNLSFAEANSFDWGPRNSSLDRGPLNSRSIIPANHLSQDGTRIRIIVGGNLYAPVEISSVYIGEKAASGDAYDMQTGTITQITFGGSTSVTITGGGTQTSDWINYNFDHTKTYIVSLGIKSAAVGIYASSSEWWENAYYRAGPGMDSEAGKADANSGYLCLNAYWNLAGFGIDTDDPAKTSNIWYCAAAFQDPERIWFSGQESGVTEKIPRLNSQYGWIYVYKAEGSRLYVYSEDNPANTFSSMQMSGRYGSPLTFSNLDYLIFQNLDLQGGYRTALGISGANHIIVEDCNLGKDSGTCGLSIGFSDSGRYSSNGIVRNNLIDADNHVANYWHAETTDDGLVFEDGTNNWTAYNNTVDGWAHTGIVIGTLSNYKVTNNNVHNNFITCPDIEYGRGFAAYGEEGSYEGNSFHHNIIKDTKTRSQIQSHGINFYNNIIDGVDCQIRPDIAQGVMIYRSTTADTEEIRIFNNIFANTDGAGVEFSENNGQGDFYGNIISNNIFYNTARNTAAYLYGTGKPVSKQDIQFIITAPKIHENFYQNNMFYKTSGEDLVYYSKDPGNNCVKTVAEFNAMNNTQGDIITNNIDGDPLFVNPDDPRGPDGVMFTDDDGLRLRDGSPAIDTGIDAGLVYSGMAPDIGAYEYVSPQAAVLYGDVSGDGEVTAYDAALTGQAAVGRLSLTADQTKAADVSGDSEVSAYDAALIAQKAVGLIDKFPVEG